jgi:hyperosmotically inducible periplasmic protein
VFVLQRPDANVIYRAVGVGAGFKMKKTPFVASGLIMFVLVAPLAGAQAPSSPARSSLAEGQSMSALDADLADRVRRTVVADRNLSTYAAKITVVASDGNVHLSGMVQNEGEKAQIGSKAAAIVGQRHVVNDLQVMSAAAASNALRDLLRAASAPAAPPVAAN